MAESDQPPEKDPVEEPGSSASNRSPSDSPSLRAADPTRILNAETKDGFGDAQAPGTSEDDWLPPPKQLGKYTIEDRIGHGGMGVVWKGHDPDLGRTVAIKVLAPHLAQSGTARQRFEREARAAAAISHPHVLTIHSVEKHEQTPFLVMEYVSGGSLKEYVSERGKLAPLQAIQLSCQIAQGLAAAHAQGVIHRDVKPGNVMLHQGGVRIRLADFGLARVTFENSELTSHDQAVGTPAYMAPEQLRGDRIDARADLFSLGCVMHYMLVGHSPFQGRTQAETIHKILGEFPRPLLETDPTVPPALAEIVDRLLRKDPDERYQSAFEVGAVLERFLTLLNQAPTDEIAGILARPGLGESGPASKTAVPFGLGKVGAGIAIVGALVVLTIILGIVFRPPGRPPDDSPSLPLSSGTAPTVPTGATGAASTNSPRVLTVAREGDAEFRAVDDAIAASQDGDTVRVLDDATYHVNLVVQNRNHLVLESGAGARLVTQTPNVHVIQVDGGKDIQIRGFRITTTGVDQHAVRIGGCDGVQLDDLTIRQEAARAVAAIHVADCNTSRTSAPLTIRNCRVQSLSSGQCLWVYADPQPVWNLIIENNQFLGSRESQSTVAVLWGRVGTTQIRNNMFASGAVGLNIYLMPLADGSTSDPAMVQVVNNSFDNCQYWIGLMSTEPETTPFTLANNLILECESVQGSPAQKQALAATGVLKGNVWERPPPAVGEDEELEHWARFEPVVDVQSRMPADKDFLRLPDDSPLLSAGAGGDLGDRVGAQP